MGALDPIRGPKGGGWFYWLVIAVVVFLLMLVSSGWWLGAATWKIAVAGGVSGLIGSLVGRWVVAQLPGRKG